MKLKKAAFTQTYGKDRELEFKLLKYDTIGNAFRNSCDIIIFSFHNCPMYFIQKMLHEYLMKLYDPKKLVIKIYDMISYKESIIRTLQYLKEENFDYILQIQDDQFGLNTSENIRIVKSVITQTNQFLKEKNPYLLHIFSDEGNNKIPRLDEYKDSFFNFDSRFFQWANIYSWNDGTYFANVEYLYNLFINIPGNVMNVGDDVWSIEMYLKRLFDNQYHERWGWRWCLFKAANIHGRNVNRSLTLKDNLLRFFPNEDIEEILKN